MFNYDEEINAVIQLVRDMTDENEIRNRKETELEHEE